MNWILNKLSFNKNEQAARQSLSATRALVFFGVVAMISACSAEDPAAKKDLSTDQATATQTTGVSSENYSSSQDIMPDTAEGYTSSSDFAPTSEQNTATKTVTNTLQEKDFNEFLPTSNIDLEKQTTDPSVYSMIVERFESQGYLAEDGYGLSGSVTPSIKANKVSEFALATNDQMIEVTLGLTYSGITDTASYWIILVSENHGIYSYQDNDWVLGLGPALEGAALRTMVDRAILKQQLPADKYQLFFGIEIDGEVIYSKLSLDIDES